MRQSALEAEREIRQKELQILQREKEIQDYSMRNQTLRLEQAEMQKERLAKDNQLRRLALERKDQQIRLENYQKVILRKENQQRLRLLEKDKRLLEQTESSHKLRIKSQRDREGLMFGLVLLSIIAGGATYLSLSKARTANLKLRVKQDETSQQNEMLGTMNRLIETKNRHITDSIKYARRIQAALLPGPEALHQALPLSLLIFRPRDVVSGDFYFLHRVPGFTYVATVDCTGHGVAGALLSMLGHQAIENLFKSGRNLMPNEMLHSIDQDMANIFKKDVSDLQKGMDMHD